ncbi:MAG: peptidoglycan DD-metalloendopeptidase family protein [Patescibacteria group bacterium]
MNTFSKKPLAAAILATSIFLLSTPLPADAQSRTSTRNSYNYWRNTREGMTSTSTIERATSRRGISSATQKAINALDDNEVEDLPIPVLLGVSLASISPNFGDPRDGGDRDHEGEDILAPKDDYIVSPTDAVVISMGSGDSSGNYVYTANPGDETFVYMHLDKFAEGLKSGTVLKPGDLIGYVGDTGNAAGGPTHLHFEIRHNRTPMDPFPRLDREFTLKERIDAVTKALKKADDEDEDAEMLATNYRSLFISARAAGLELPDALEEALGVSGKTVATVAFSRDLTVGSQGDDVTALQTFLITASKGPKATALASAGATGYFGALTQAALAEYQASASISPSAGYFGPLTRVQIVMLTTT